METTKNEMPKYAKHFFNKLGDYLDTKIYYYGSVQRLDYFPSSSDIDTDIFTDNESSTISKLQNFLEIPKYEFRKIVYRLHKANVMVQGYKVKYEDKENNFVTEISIYNEKNKKDVLLEHNSKTVLPFHISILLLVLKTFWYKIPILPESVYAYLKKLVMNYMVEGGDVEFISVEIPKHEVKTPYIF
jgi:hypothetical protein